MADTKITRLRNLLTPMKNFIAMVNANKRGESISTLLLDRELETINKYSNEIWAIIAEIPNDACDGKCSNDDSGLHLQRVSNNEARVAVCDCDKPKYVLNEVKQELMCQCGKRYLLAN